MSGVEAVMAMRKIHWDGAQQWVDQTLNWRPPGVALQSKFVALPVAFVIFMNIDDMRSLDPCDCQYGSVSESEMTVTLPLVEWRNGRIPRLAFYPILLCMDSSPAMIIGREVFGFPKVHGRVAVGEHGCEAESEACAGELRTCKGARLVSLWRGGAGCGPGRVDCGPGSVGRMLAEMVGDEWERGTSFWGVPDFFWESLWGGRTREWLYGWVMGALRQMSATQQFVFLKQFRHISFAGQACHRSVASAALRFFDLSSCQREWGDWELEVAGYRSASLLKRIGLQSGPVMAPLRVKCALDLPLGREIWST